MSTPKNSTGHINEASNSVHGPSNNHGVQLNGSNVTVGRDFVVNRQDDPLDRLPRALEAAFNSHTKEDEPTCLKDTRVDLLRDIHCWADGQDERCIFWLNGLAGTGKSTVARTIARYYYNKKRLAASFFFSRGGGDAGNASKFATTIAFQLAANIKQLEHYIKEAVNNHRDIVYQSLRDQWKHLVLSPLSKLKEPLALSYVLVVDALDECEDDNKIKIIVQLLAEARSLERVRLRVFLTSRPEVPIRYGFGRIPNEEHQDFVLHNISPLIVDHDITLFLKHNLRHIAREYHLSADWPGTEIIEQLVLRACGLFIWAATACRFIRDGKRFAIKRLQTILASDNSPNVAPEKHLNDIYVTVLKNSVSPEYSDDEKEEHCNTLRYILGSVVLLVSALSARSLERLLHMDERIEATLADLHAILDIPRDQSHYLRLHHPSFRDFLLSKDRCSDANFWVDEMQAHGSLMDNCIRLMSKSLKQDLCGVNTPGVLASAVSRHHIEQCLPLELQYACLYWVHHLQKRGMRLSDDDNVYKFLKGHFLHWLEALSWMGKVSEGIHAISSLESIAKASDAPKLSVFIHDMKRFALYSHSAIELAPLQIYCSALVVAPCKSIVKREFMKVSSQWVKIPPKVEDEWSALLQTLEGHGGSVSSVAFSHDSTRLASGSDDETVKIWDASSGACLQTLEGHGGSVSSVAFSHDSTRLASGSYDRTVKIWDASSGACLQTLEGHGDVVRSVAFSHDSTWLASGSDDDTVKIWDVGSGACLQTLEGHSNGVRSVAFSHDSTRLASGSWDRTVKIWDASSGACLQTLEGHGGTVESVAFSHDSTRLASGSWDRTVKIWDASSGACLQTLEGHGNRVESVAFSHDSTRLASGSWDDTVKIWDVGSGACLQTLEGHGGTVESVAFSHHSTRLASGSRDGTVKIWDASSGACLQTLEGHGDGVSSVAFSHDSTQLASGSWDWNGTIKIWDASSGACLQTLEGHGHTVTTVAFSHDSTRLASGSRDRTVKIWDASSGACLQTLEGHSSLVNSVAFDPIPRATLCKDIALSSDGVWITVRSENLL